MKNLILVQSKPGLGKTTLAKSVAAALTNGGMPAVHFSLGERLRAVSNGEADSAYASKLASKAKDLAQHGVIDDPEIIHGLVQEALEQLDEKVVIIDGYPRYSRLIEGFNNLVENGEVNVLQLVVIDGSDNFASERMMTRGRKLLGQEEDAAARLAAHRQEVEPVILALEKTYPTLHIDATKELPEKTAEVVACVRGLSLL